MTYNDTNAVYALNSYVWKLLRVNLGLSTTDYGGGIPMGPSAQQPELMTTGKPFIIFGSVVGPAAHLYALRTESIGYTIYASTATEADRIANLLVETFERQDESAADVNEWMDIEKEETEFRHHNIHFGSCRVTIAEKAEPAESEGGFYSAMVLIECKYTSNGTPPVTNGFTYP